MSLSLVSIVPAAHLAALNALGVALGWSDGEHSVPLSATGNAPATHYGLRAWAREQTRATFEALKASPASAPAVPGHSASAVQAAITAVVLDWADDAPGIGSTHWEAVTQGLGLRSIQSAHQE